MIYTLQEDEYKKYYEWNKKHKETCPLYGNDGAIGGRLTFCFTPTSLGVITKIKCGCGESIDVTDSSTW